MTWPLVDLAFWNPGTPRSAAIDALLADPSVPLSRQGLTGIAAAYSRETGAPLHDEHRHWAHELGVRTLAADGALTEVAPLLDEAGIDFFVAKGPVIAYRDYPEPSMRPYCDLDIYVVESQVSAARSLLASAGYTSVHHAVGVLGGLAQEVHGGRFGAVVEVHAHPIDNLHRRHLPPVSAFMDHVQRVSLCGVSVPVLSSAADLALQAIHLAAGHRYAKLALLRDIELALSRVSSTPFDSVGAYVSTAARLLGALGRPVAARGSSGVAAGPLVRALSSTDPVTWDEYRASRANVLALVNEASWGQGLRCALGAVGGLAPTRSRRVGIRMSTPAMAGRTAEQ